MYIQHSFALNTTTDEVRAHGGIPTHAEKPTTVDCVLFYQKAQV